MIMRRHVLPNAMVATLTFLPFILNSSITALTSLDFLGLGLPPEQELDLEPGLRFEHPLGPAP